MKFVTFKVARYGVLAVPAQFAPVCWQHVVDQDFDGFFIHSWDALLVAQLPGAFWVK
jgi:hypothetical protein